jgi:hypothetical protein
MLPNFRLEASLPRSTAWWLVIEHIIIPLIPNSPGTYHEYFHKEMLIELLLRKNNFVMNIGVLIPLNTKSKPTISCRETIKEQVFHSFL